MFFSVKQPIKIAGKDYIPCVCYPLPKFLEYTVNFLKKEGKAEIYDKMVFFQNGKLVEKSVEKSVEKADTKCDKEPDTTGEPERSEKKSKKKKEAPVEEEPIPSPEEIADNVEDF